MPRPAAPDDHARGLAPGVSGGGGRSRPGLAGPAGITGVVLLAESHLAVHTWPELGRVTLDVYVCNLGRDNSACAQALMAQLAAQFEPTERQMQQLWRGGAGELSPA